jgi:hypothetical protein|tara:strand:- start:92 stop:469 length:378 start_codon:yes stop_codon:yes gene_type:complete
MKLNLSVLEDLFTIHRISSDNEIPIQVFDGTFYNITKTEEELSIICSSSVLLDSESSETGWSCIKVLGRLDFNLTGILADILAILAESKISIIAISTFDTDYILVKSKKLQGATKALLRAQYTFK